MRWELPGEVRASRCIPFHQELVSACWSHIHVQSPWPWTTLTKGSTTLTFVSPSVWTVGCTKVGVQLRVTATFLLCLPEDVLFDIWGIPAGLRQSYR